MTTIDRAAAVLTDDMLERFDERGAEYDRENRFFQEDFDELRASGYLNGRQADPGPACAADHAEIVALLEPA